ncbi:MAG: hypothetical protein D3906_02120 [Candidatus Electrothrix sp. AUS1_2]|nr:hypothetical protein [Candidatus Electrothrix sp. AUS1_2]
MNEIDEQLRKENVPIHSRCIRAGGEYSRRYSLKFYIALENDSGTLGNYSDEYVGGHIEGWYNRRYGDRQNIDMSLGSTALILRGDLWKLKLPYFLGRVRFAIERDLSKHNKAVITTQKLPVFNILPMIDGLTQELAWHLTDNECKNILIIFSSMLHSFQLINGLKDYPYFLEIETDISTAVTVMFASRPHFGQSKWASSQAAEKFIKCLLKSRNVPFPKNHNLQTLADLASKEGVRLDTDVVSKASTAAGVRYGEIQVTADEAVQAHYASLVIGQQISHAVGKKI